MDPCTPSHQFDQPAGLISALVWVSDISSLFPEKLEHLPVHCKSFAKIVVLSRLVAACNHWSCADFIMCLSRLSAVASFCFLLHVLKHSDILQWTSKEHVTTLMSFGFEADAARAALVVCILVVLQSHPAGCLVSSRRACEQCYSCQFRGGMAVQPDRCVGVDESHVVLI